MLATENRNDSFAVCLPSDSIINDIWAVTNEAKLILADLSEKNANVFYELGMAHALAKPAILVTESMDDVPFDLRSLRVIVYEKNRPDWGDALREKIELAIKEVLASPLDAVLPTFIRVKESSTQPSASKVEKDMISLRQDVDRLTRELRFASSSLSPSASMSPSVRYDLAAFLSLSDRARSRFTHIARRALALGRPRVNVARELTPYGLSLEAAHWLLDSTEVAGRPELKSSDSPVEAKGSEESDATSGKD